MISREKATADEETQRRNKEKLRHELGPVVCSALDNPDIVEIMVNPDGSIWLDCIKSGMEGTGEHVAFGRRMAALGTIAAILGAEVNSKSSILKGELPFDGSRVRGTVPPTSSGPGFCIRKHSSAVFPISRYLAEKRISDAHWTYLQNAIEEKKNILVAGGTGSGKTTFTNALLDTLNKLNPMDRLVVMEDTLELQYSSKNVYSLRTDGENEITLQYLLKTALQLRPDRIIVGEVLGGEALDLLKSWNTGHPGGISTLHANSAESALTRLELLVSEVSVSPMKELIGEVVDVVVFLKREARKGPVVTEVLEVKGVDVKSGVYNCVSR
ncbi:MAG: P-type conjugative transfer ATPase TrbB [Synergistaceae bacterium]|jgi:type IV secretion system protein VirB11|nr:P-type conjugative transfer ATPase TrbB [Synergistaceae bacterium]